MSRLTQPMPPDAGPADDTTPAPAPKPAGHAPVAVSGFALDPPPPPPPPQLILGDGPVLWVGRIPADKSSKVLVFRGPEHPMEAAVYYLKCLGAISTVHKVEVRTLDAVPHGWADPPAPVPPPDLAPEFSPHAAPSPLWTNR